MREIPDLSPNPGVASSIGGTLKERLDVREVLKQWAGGLVAVHNWPAPSTV
jgi:hypothetical protein